MIRLNLETLVERTLEPFKDRGFSLSIELWNEQIIDLDRNPSATLVLTQPRALRHFLKPNFSALGIAYAEGEIDVKGSMREAMLAMQNLSEAKTDWPLERVPLVSNLLERQPFARWFDSVMKLTMTNGFLARAQHTRSTDADAIRFHYDVSNDFYRLWLDRNMVYSCAYFRHDDDDLDQAQLNKLDHICRKLQLAPGDRFLDVGCGWGALIIHAARHYGVRAHGITLSRQQYEFAMARVREEGLEDQITLEIRDYRDIAELGPFDKIASVGMIEHVGVANLPVYFKTLSNALRDGGWLLNHGINSRTRSMASELGADFICQYVFPDGELPILTEVAEQMENSGLEITDVESLRTHYSRTLWKWHERLEAQKDEATQLVGDKTFRVWNAYLPGCAYAFERSWISIHQFLGVKGAETARARIPLTREYIYK